MAAAEGRSVGVERWTVYLLLSAQIMNNLAIRFGLPALIFFMQQEFRWSPTQLARVTGAFFPGCARPPAQLNPRRAVRSLTAVSRVLSMRWA